METAESNLRSDFMQFLLSTDDLSSVTKCLEGCGCGLEELLMYAADGLPMFCDALEDIGIDKVIGELLFEALKVFQAIQGLCEKGKQVLTMLEGLDGTESSKRLLDQAWKWDAGHVSRRPDIETSARDLSRQEGTFGVDACREMSQLRVLILGLDGAGTEVAKNLALIGVRSIVLWDDPSRRWYPSDGGFDFCVAEMVCAPQQETGTRCKASVVAQRIRSLNEAMEVIACCEALSAEEALTLHPDVDTVVVASLLSWNEMATINRYCRLLHATLVHVWQQGPFGTLAVDFGKSHVVKNTSSTATDREYSIGGIQVACNSSRDALSVVITGCREADLVTMERRSPALCFTISGDGETLSEIEPAKKCMWYISAGDGAAMTLELVEHPCLLHQDVEAIYKGLLKLSEELDRGSSVIALREQEVPQIVSHQCIVDQVTCLPDKLHDADGDLMYVANPLACIALSIAMSSSVHRENGIVRLLDAAGEPRCLVPVEWYVRATCPKHMQVARCAALCATLGGLAAQEVVKTIGRYVPLSNITGYCSRPALVGLRQKFGTMVDWSSPLDHLRAFYGDHGVDKLAKAHIFVAGAGAIGCEVIKNIALLGVGRVTVIDGDHVERSNLCRQFLFDEASVGHSKSRIAARRAQGMMITGTRHGATGAHIFGLEGFLTRNSTDLLPDAFWSSITLAMGALDNVIARFLVDDMCAIHEKPYVEAGTNGVACTFASFLPVTTCTYMEWRMRGNPYIDSTRTAADLEMKRDNTPVCTIKNFPHSSLHCIAWALGRFDVTFARSAETMRRLIRRAKDDDVARSLCDDPLTFAELRSGVRRSTDISFRSMLASALLHLVRTQNSTTTEEALHFAVSFGIEQTYLNVVLPIDLLDRRFPANSRDQNGNLFWSGNRRHPRSISQENDSWERCSGIVLSFAAMLLSLTRWSAIEVPASLVQKRLAEERSSPPPSAIYVEVEDLDREFAIGPTLEQDHDVRERARMNIRERFDEVLRNTELGGPLTPWVIPSSAFDKDNAVHVGVVHELSNMRCWQYCLPLLSSLETRLEAGRVMPAVATTTSIVSGLSSMSAVELSLGLDVPARGAALQSANDVITTFELPKRDAMAVNPVDVRDVSTTPEHVTRPAFCARDQLLVTISSEATVGDLLDALREMTGVLPSLLSIMTLPDEKAPPATVFDASADETAEEQRTVSLLHALKDRGEKLVGRRVYPYLTAAWPTLRNGVKFVNPRIVVQLPSTQGISE